MDKKLDFLTKELVDQAVIEIDKNGIPPKREGTNYAILINGKNYPFKLLVTEAAKAAEHILTSKEFNSTANNRQGFKALTGYEVLNLSEMKEYFDIKGLLRYKNFAGNPYDSSSAGSHIYNDTRTKLQYLGGQLAQETGLSLVNNYNEKPNKMAGRGKGFVLKEYILTGYLPEKYAHLEKSVFLKLTFNSFHAQLKFGINIDVNFSDTTNTYNKFRDKFQNDAFWTTPVDQTFPNSWEELLVLITPIFTKQVNILESFLLKQKSMIDLNRLIDPIKYKKQIILQGPPGTGKTYIAKDIAEQLIFDEVSNVKNEQSNNLEVSDQFKLVQFHPSYSYEDFVRGISVKSTDSGDIKYETVNRSFADFAKRANENSHLKYVMIIDEINRANLPSVLGELIYGLEYRGQAVDSMYELKNADSKITIPNNLYIIGTMNTADRSVGHIDYAIRRRFAFVEMLPKSLDDLGEKFKKKEFELVSSLFVKGIKTNSINLVASEHLNPEFAERPQDVWLGHSYFIEQADEDDTPINFQMRIQYEIIPILEEYVKDGILKNSKAVKDILKKLLNIGSDGAV